MTIQFTNIIRRWEKQKTIVAVLVSACVGVCAGGGEGVWISIARGEDGAPVTGEGRWPAGGRMWAGKSMPAPGR